MKIEMKPILNGETDKIVIDYEFDLPVEYIPGDIVADKPVRVDGSIIAYSGYTELKIHAVIDYTVECAKCLKPINDVIAIDFVKTIAAEGTLENEDNDDYIIIEEGIIDIEVPLIEQISMELPFKQTCRDDCKGLCFKCGKNLNDGECECETKEIDPRLAILQQYIDIDTEKE